MAELHSFLGYTGYGEREKEREMTLEGRGLKIGPQNLFSNKV